jgi:hypothetical protein
MKVLVLCVLELSIPFLQHELVQYNIYIIVILCTVSPLFVNWKLRMRLVIRRLPMFVMQIYSFIFVSSQFTFHWLFIFEFPLVASCFSTFCRLPVLHSSIRCISPI